MILIDTREQEPFWFPEPSKRFKLGEGDYSSEALIDILRIERKASVNEIYTNLGKVKAKARFFRELEKLAKFPHAVILAEFPERLISEFPNGSGIPKTRKASKYEIAAGKRKDGEIIDCWGELRIGAKKLLSLVAEVEAIIPIVYCENRRQAENFVRNKIKELEEQYR